MYDYEPVGYYVPRRGKGDSDELGADYDLLCPECAAYECVAQGLDISNDTEPVFADSESDSLEYCAVCEERIDTELTDYGRNQLRDRVLDAVRRNNLGEARRWAEIADELPDQPRVYAFCFGDDSDQPALSISEPHASYHDAASAMLATYGYSDDKHGMEVSRNAQAMITDIWAHWHNGGSAWVDSFTCKDYLDELERIYQQFKPIA